eukprot:GHVU01126004.1.p1 GENE.GHVU01126004.1~~GHVU01126004.1.p1  ORF type:complete len:215 (+),score=53.32 GHVU01126004.1:127-771(+)
MGVVAVPTAAAERGDYYGGGAPGGGKQQGGKKGAAAGDYMNREGGADPKKNHRRSSSSGAAAAGAASSGSPGSTACSTSASSPSGPSSSAAAKSTLDAIEAVLSQDDVITEIRQEFVDSLTIHIDPETGDSVPGGGAAASSLWSRKDPLHLCIAAAFERNLKQAQVKAWVEAFTGNFVAAYAITVADRPHAVFRVILAALIVYGFNVKVRPYSE